LWPDKYEGNSSIVSFSTYTKGDNNLAVIHVRHIRTALNKFYDGKIDLSDVQGKSPEELENFYLTRALAAYTVYFLAESSIDDSAHTVTDSFEDNGIDAIKYDPSTNTLWLIQSKWIKSGNGCPDTGEVQKFVSGVKDLINEKWDRFNDKIRGKESEVESALDDYNLRIKLVLAYTGGLLSKHQKRPIDDLLNELNSPSEIAEFINYSLKSIHKAVVTLSQGEAISFELPLYQWGHIESPRQIFYGHTSCADLANIWAQYEQRFENLDVSVSEDQIKQKTVIALAKIIEVIEQDYSDAMVGRLFYNYTKTKDIVSKATGRI